jgi:hypothetical protein
MNNPGAHVVIRSAQSGAWLGTLVERDADTVELADARRLWYWDGAATLSQLALEGVARPRSCKFPPEVAHVIVLGVCEIIDATDEAVASVDAVPAWRA